MISEPNQIGMWLSLVERSVRDREAAGSNPVIPTYELLGIRSFFDKERRKGYGRGYDRSAV